MIQVQTLQDEKAAIEDKLQRLHEDFKYNLELLDGRDAELHSYEQHMIMLHACADQANEENEKLNICLCQTAQRECIPASDIRPANGYPMHPVLLSFFKPA